MLSKPFAILTLLLSGLAAFAQGPAATLSPSTMAALKRHHGPMRLLGESASGQVTSANWGGYAVTGTKFTKALGSWIAPTLDCGRTPNTLSYYWVGLDGYANDTVELIGTGANCAETTPEYFAWYDFSPNDPVVISMAVSPNDKMSATVSYDGSKFSLKMTNHTTGRAFKVTRAFASAQRASAEWVVEGNGPLANFKTVSFGDDYTSVNDTNWAIDSAVTGPISDFGANVKKITMVTSSGANRAVPAALSADGSSFKVTWKRE